MERFGLERCAQVPGFIYRTHEDGIALKSPYWTLAGTQGIAIPVRNLADQIIAIKIRKDKETQGDKYSYLFSHWHGGPSPGSSVHIPYHPGIAHLVARLTEGELKADSITLRTGILTVAVPGVSCWSPVMPLLESIQPARVRVAYDADFRRNPNVIRPLIHLIVTLREFDFQVAFRESGIADQADECDHRRRQDRSMCATGKFPRFPRRPRS